MKKFSTIVLISFLAVLLVAGSASAIPIITLDDGINPVVTIKDDEIDDLGVSPGVVVFNGSIGNFIVNVTTGITKPVLGSEADPQLHLNSVNVSNVSGATGSLTITFSEDGYKGGSLAGFESLIGGTTNGTVSAITYINGAVLSSLGPFGPGAFSDTEEILLADIPESFSLGMSATITHGSGAKVSSFGLKLKSVSVPDAGIMLLLGPALLGLGIFGRKFNKR